MNITQLRNIITDLLDGTPSLIGSYALPDGTKIPAVYVAGRQGVPGEWKVEGLEVVIQEFPRLNPRPGVGTLQQRKEWALTMIDYLPSSDKLLLAAERISRYFPDARLSFTPESDVVYGQYRIVIPDVEIQTVLR